MTSKYRPDIDGLRAIAVLAVVGFHAFGVMGGFTGVDIFFVISGFVISTIIFEDFENKTFTFNDFYQRRVRRIFPSLILVLAASSIFGWFFLFSDEYTQLGKHIGAASGFLSNLALWNESGYFDVGADKKPFLHLWSLAVEAQFYLFWPIFVWVLWKYKTNKLLILFIILAISFGLNVWNIFSDSTFSFYSPLTRFWELLCGSALAYLLIFQPQFSKAIDSRSNLISILGALLMLGGIAFLTKELDFPGWWALIPVLGASLVIATGRTSWIGKNILSHPILIWFGLISFPLYLWHWPLLSFARILGDPPRSLIVALILASILLAWLSYNYIEKPIRRGGNKNIKTVLLCFFMALEGLFGLYIYKSKGLTDRLNHIESWQISNSIHSQLDWPETNNKTKECTKKYGGDQYCLISNIDKPPTAAIIGTSRANDFYFGLSEYIQQQGGNLLLLGAGGCTPFFEIDFIKNSAAPNLNCYQRTKDLYRFVLEDANIKTVFIAFNHNAPFSNDYIMLDKLGQITSDNKYQNIVQALVRTIKMLQNNNKKVVLLYDLPNLNRDIKECALVRPYLEKAKCSPKDVAFVNDFDQYEKMISEVQGKTGVYVFRGNQYLEGTFPIDRDENLYYRDATHLTYRGSMFFVDKYKFTF